MFDIYASPLNPTWTPASETILQPSPTYTVAPHQNLTIDGEPSANTALSKKFVDSRCSAQQRYAIEAAWYEASLLDQAQQKYVPGGAFSTAMINYFGNNVGNNVGNTKDYANGPQGIWEQAKLKGAYWSCITRKCICRVIANDCFAEHSLS